MYLTNDERKPTKLEIQSGLVSRALLFLSGSSDDAQESDGAGFNENDREYGDSLARSARLSSLGPREEYAGWKISKKYWRQLRKADSPIVLPKKWVNKYKIEDKKIDSCAVWNLSKGSGPYELKMIGDNDFSCTCEAYGSGNVCGHIDFVIDSGVFEPIEHGDTLLEVCEAPSVVEPEPEGITDYEMLPGLKANQGQLSALSNLKKFVYGESNLYLLTGYAGTGKTTLVQALISDLRAEGYTGAIVFTAPTNKAANVLRAMVTQWNLGIECVTCAKLLGLKPQIDLETGKQTFKKAYNEDSSIQDYDLVVVDEGSMCSEELWGYIEEEANMFTRILAMGDPAQLPPVNEAISQVFLSIPDKSHLSEVMRYRGSIAAMADEIRRNLSRKSEPFFKTEYNEDGSEGLFVFSRQDWNANIVRAFNSEKYLENPNYCRVLAYTNKRVKTINQMVRASIRGEGAPRFVSGERLIATDHYSIDSPFGPATTVFNSSAEMEVNAVSTGMEGRWKVWFLDVTRFEDGASFLVPVLHEDCFNEFEATQKELKQAALNGHKSRWKDYHDNRSRFAYVDYAYAITTHKSQGSTFDNVFVAADDILTNRRRSFVQMPGESKKRWIYEKNQLLYVAMTRPSKRLFIVE